MENDQFILACENPELRPRFVKSISLEDSARFISEVEYDPKPFCVGPSGLGARFRLGFHTNRLSIYGIPKRRGKIVVYPDAFSREDNPIQNTEDFRSALVHHEGEHARQHYEEAIKIGLYRLLGMEEKLHHYLERGAYANQVKHLTEKNSEALIKRVLDRLEMHHLCLQG